MGRMGRMERMGRRMVPGFIRDSNRSERQHRSKFLGGNGPFTGMHGVVQVCRKVPQINRLPFCLRTKPLPKRSRWSARPPDTRSSSPNAATIVSRSSSTTRTAPSFSPSCATTPIFAKSAFTVTRSCLATFTSSSPAKSADSDDVEFRRSTRSQIPDPPTPPSRSEISRSGGQANGLPKAKPRPPPKPDPSLYTPKVPRRLPRSPPLTPPTQNH